MDNKIIAAGMFNNKASEQDRQDKLEYLIKKDGIEESDEENEIPNDEQLNEMISRSDEEFNLFTKMDQKRYEEENKNFLMGEFKEKNTDIHHKHINYRLMPEWEVPDWVKYQEDSIRGEDYGLLGKRERRKINYSDALTENQFTKIIDEGGDLHAEIEKANVKKNQKDDENENKSNESRNSKSDG